MHSIYNNVLPKPLKNEGTSLNVFKQVNLMQYMKLSTSRDFRINAATLEAALQEQEQQQDESQQVCLCLNMFILRQCCGFGLFIFNGVFISFFRLKILRFQRKIKHQRKRGGSSEKKSPFALFTTLFIHFSHFNTEFVLGVAISVLRETASPAFILFIPQILYPCSLLFSFGQRPFGDLYNLINVQRLTCWYIKTGSSWFPVAHQQYIIHF